MNLVDSCGWIEYFSDSSHADFYADAVENIDELIVPAVCIAEVFKKLYVTVNENDALIAIAHMRQGKIIPFTESIALAAAAFGIEKKLPFADSVIYATGIISNALVFTQDRHFKELEGVRFLDIHEPL